MFDILSVSFSFPQVPPFEGMHVLVVHFPIALWLTAPVFVLVATVLPVRGRWCSFAALALMILATVGAFAAVSTGEAARDGIEEGKDEMFAVLRQHEQLADLLRIVFVIVTTLYALFTLLPSVVRTWIAPSYLVPVQMVFLLVLLASSLLVANTAHLGGRMVHEFGVRAVMTAPPEAEE